MLTKEFLNNYLICEGRINAKLEKILELKQRAKSIAYVFKEKVQTSKQINGTEKIIASYLDLENELLKDLDLLKSKQKEITKIIETACDKNEIELMERKYINGQSFSKIAEKMGISERQLYRMHGKCLDKVEEVLKNNQSTLLSKML